MYAKAPSGNPAIFRARLMGRIEGCTNPESAELLLDGEAFIFGNCTHQVGHPAYRDGKGIVYIKGEAFISRARIVAHGDVVLDERRLVTGLTATLGCDILKRATEKFPAGTVFIDEGANPVTEKRGDDVLVNRNLVEPRIVAFNPLSGKILGHIPLGPNSDLAQKYNGIDQPNGLALSEDGDIYFGDIPNGNPAAQLPPPVPAAIYRIPHAAIDDICNGVKGAAEAVERILTPGWINGLTVSKDENICWAVSCSMHDPVEGGLYRLTRADFAVGRQPEPIVAGLGIIDGIGVSKRGTLFASTPRSGEVHAFPTDGSHHLLRIEEDEKIVRMPADFNICYPHALDGEPALLVTDISVGCAPGDGTVAVVDISGL